MRIEEVYGEWLERDAPAGHPLLDPLCRVAGYGAVQDHRQRMPLVIPFARDDVGLLAILAWPTPQPTVADPVVRCRGSRLELRAASVGDWIKQQLAELDAGGSLPPELCEAAGDLYNTGDLAQTGLPLPVWVVLKGGGAPWAYAQLVARHTAHGDATAALIAAERACERFPGWAELHARRYRQLVATDGIAARDAATAAMALPMWTLSGDVTPLATGIGWQPPFDGSNYRRLADDEERLPADRAAYVMDAVAMGSGDWDSARAEVSHLYKEAGLAGVARLAGA